MRFLNHTPSHSDIHNEKAWEPKNANRTINVPPSEEIEKFLEVLWQADRKQQMIDFCHKVEKYRVQNDKLTDHGLSPLLEDRAWCYMSWILNSTDLDGIKTNRKHTSSDRDLDYLHLLASIQQNTQTQKINMKRFHGSIRDVHDPKNTKYYEEDAFITGITLVNYKKNIVTNTLSEKEIVFVLTWHLIHPWYLKKSSNAEKKQFFHLFLSAQKKFLYFQDPQSFFWEYILKYFWDIEIVQSHFERVNKAALPSLNTVKDKANQILSHSSVSQRTPTQEEVSDICQYLWQLNRLQHIMELIKLLKKTKRSNKILTPTDTLGLQAEDVVWAHISGSIDFDLTTSNILVQKDPGGTMKGRPIYEGFLMSKRVPALTQVWLVESISEIFTKRVSPANSQQEFSDMMMSIMLINYNDNLVDQQIDAKDFFDVSLMFVFYPLYLLKADRGYQERFFELFFRGQEDREEIRDPESVIWRHLMKYLGDIPAVHKHYQKYFWSTVSENHKEKKLENELLELLTIFWYADKANRVLQLRKHLDSCSNSHVPIKSLDDMEWRYLRDVWQIYLSGNLDISLLASGKFPVLKESKDEWKDQNMYDPLYTFLLVSDCLDLATRNKGLQDLLNDNQLKNTDLWIYGDELADMVFAITSLKYNRLDANKMKQHYGDLFRKFLILLLCPGYLKNTTPIEQERFFSRFFSLLKKKKTSPEETDFLREYLFRDFWSVELVQKYFKETSKITRPTTKSKKGRRVGQKWKKRVSSPTTPDSRDEEEEETQKEELPLTRISSIRKHDFSTKIDGAICSLSSNLEPLPWFFFHVVVWDKTGSWKLKSPCTYIAEDIKNLEVDFALWKNIIQIIRLDTDAKLNRESLSTYRNDLITIPIQRDQEFETPKKIVTVEVPDYDTLETFVSFQKNGVIDVNNNTITFLMPLSDDFLDENNIRDVIQECHIVYDISGSDPKLISYFGIDSYQVINTDNFETLENYCLDVMLKRIEEQDNHDKEILKAQEAREKQAEKEKLAKQKQERKSIEEWIDQLWELPKRYIDARNFLKICEENDLYHTVQWQKILAWTLPKGKSFLEKMKEDMKKIWYDISIQSWDRNVLTHLSLSNSKQQISIQIDLKATTDYKNICVVKSSETDTTQKWVIQYILEHILAYLLHSDYEKFADKQQVKRLAIEAQDREWLRDSTAKKVWLGTASFIEWWKESAIGSQWWEHPDIDIYPILWRRWSINVWSWFKMNDELRQQYYEKLIELMFHSDSYVLVEYFYKRLLITLGKTPGNGISAISNTKAKQVVKNHANTIIENEDISVKIDVCEEVLKDIYDLWIPVYPMKPIDFSRRELKRK